MLQWGIPLPLQICIKICFLRSASGSARQASLIFFSELPINKSIPGKIQNLPSNADFIDQEALVKNLLFFNIRNFVKKKFYFVIHFTSEASWKNVFSAVVNLSTEEPLCSLIHRCEHWSWSGLSCEAASVRSLEIVVGVTGTKLEPDSVKEVLWNIL